MVTLILVILISFCFLSIVVADNATHDDKNTTHHDKPIDKDTTDNKTDTNKTDNKTKGNFIIAKGSGDDIRFSDGFRGFRLDYSKPAASSGDEFVRASASSAGNSHTLERAVIECYKHGLSGQIGKIMAGFIKGGSSGGEIGEAVASSHEKTGSHAVAKINNHTEAVFDFEVLKSESGNKSDYFAYKVSYRNINSNTNQTNLTNITNATNITDNMTNMTLLFDNETNATFLEELLDLLLFLADMLYDAWEHIIDTIIDDILIFIAAIEEMVKLYEEIMAEIQEMMDAIEKFINMLESLWKEIDGFLKLVGILLSALQQLLNFIESLLNYIMALISAIISLIQQLLGLLASLINFIIDLINQLISLVQAIIDFLKAVGNVLVNVIESAVILISAFLLITIGTFIYNRIR